MKIGILFPHQLFEDHEIYHACDTLYLVEEHLFFREFQFHKQKLAFHRASMQYHYRLLQEKGFTVEYIESHQESSDIRFLLRELAKKGDPSIHFINPTDNWLEKRIAKTVSEHSLEIEEYENPLFLNTRSDLKHFFKPSKKSFFQTTFYKQQREQRGILMEGDGEPAGGKWTFDTENRKKYPKKQTPPTVQFPAVTPNWKEAIEYVEKHFTANPGKITDTPYYPTTHKESGQWLQQFLEQRFYAFGDYEDAIVPGQSILHHSVLTPMLNVGLLQPQQVLDAALSYAKEKDTPINSVEGFVRQIIGWREFIRGMYEAKGTYSRTQNFWGFSREIPASFYEGTTGIPPIDDTIKRILKTGYCHHIERLMVLGNFMLLCEFHPDAVYRWFMELFIDSYDWVMVPNVYGMSQFADGGTFATKPYISGSNYILKMSDYKKGDWQQTWDGLFWRFMHVNRDFFSKNPRLAMLLGSFDRMSEEKQQAHLDHAEDYLHQLDQALASGK